MKLIQHKIFLLGFMGCGKSTLGKKLANKLGFQFFDLDKCIEEKVQMSITDIFKTKGEEQFRKLESDELINILNSNDNYVVALGGGAPCFNENMDLINNSGTSIYLKYNEGILASRLINAKAERPLIVNKTKEELIDFIAKLLKEREQYYLKSKLVIEGTNITVNEVTDLLFKDS
ncbi:shikimate kinase [Vicingus serpentipes]|uniref:Shikimate kinase n=1 Tax=Vicingus serpentipes TaxID=1926625 RepID=A0A5C6RXF3_9FLAO|nr:shikimate kinase [Vicingus serpentipes]TXB66991.1 shikimate kinase [Vicingus serpentipes]